MAASEGEKSSPRISKLPLPISDSPLVIDLPDGQKIVVGKMTLGSVIEVATWRGVGRPDSRTSRLMLGMGNGNVNEDSDSESSGEKRAPVKPKGFAGFIFTLQQIVKNFGRINLKGINWSATFKALLGSLKSKKRAKPARSEATSTESPVQTKSSTPDVKTAVAPIRASEDTDIEEWLNKITQKAARETSVKKPQSKTTGSKSTGSASAGGVKAKVTVKKAAPKAANPRSSKK